DDGRGPRDEIEVSTSVDIGVGGERNRDHALLLPIFVEPVEADVGSTTRAHAARDALVDLEADARAAALRSAARAAPVLDGVERLVRRQRRGEPHASAFGFVIPAEIEPVELDVEESSPDRFVAQEIVGAEREDAQAIVLGDAVRAPGLIVP